MSASTRADAASQWSLVFEGYDPAREGVREALCTLDNGYFATRAAASSAKADGVAYPGTYLAGGYDRLLTEIEGRTVENEELVNLSNWLALDVRIEDQDWFDVSTATLLSYTQELDLKRGLLVRTIGLACAPVKIGLAAPITDLRRFVRLDGRRVSLQHQSVSRQPRSAITGCFRRLHNPEN